MKGYLRVTLRELLNKTVEEPEKTDEAYMQRLLSGFCCPYNNDVEKFLHKKAIPFEKQGIAVTHLVLASYKEEWVLAGYFTLASKYFHVDIGHSKVGSNLKRRIKKFGAYEADIKRQIIPAPLIGQMGKNFHNGYNSLISGDELLGIACNTVREAQAVVGGKLVYLECEDVPALLDFYERNGFVAFGRRELEPAEERHFKGEYLVELLKYLD